ncbi:MAG: hypothetical protein ACK4Q5_09250 [Saprospiraceae bacterium]
MKKVLALGGAVALVAVMAFGFSSNNNCCTSAGTAAASAQGNTECCADPQACDTQAGTCCGLPCPLPCCE